MVKSGSFLKGLSIRISYLPFSALFSYLTYMLILCKHIFLLLPMISRFLNRERLSGKGPPICFLCSCNMYVNRT